MSAIAGIYYLDGRPVERADLGRMVDILAHRGPDGAGAWSEGPVGLGHRMLWTTPESLQEQLPLVNNTSDFVITADARIDNRDELISVLGLTDRSSEKITDSQLILSAYERWGESCPEHLLGDFAFAIWDGRKKVLFCARDHFGVKPFYYHRSDRLFVFGSEIKALLCLPEVPRRLNETRVAEYLLDMQEDKVITFYQEIFRLPPAHRMTVSKVGVQPSQYWALDPARELRLEADEEYAEALRNLFMDAVRCRLRSAFSVGSMLSGGLDSSSIVCTARQLLQGGHHHLHTFSAIFDDVPESDERPYINAVLAQGDLAPYYVHADRLSPLADLDRVLWHQDEAFYAPNLFIHWGLFRAAHQQGVRVQMDGSDGDTVVSYGLNYLTELAAQGQWQTFATEAYGLSPHFETTPSKFLQRFGTPHLTELARGGRWLAFAGQTHCVSKWFNIPFWRLFLAYGLRPTTPEAMRRVWRVLRGRKKPTKHTFIRAEFAKRVSLAERFRALQEYQWCTAQTEREDHYHLLTGGIHPFAFEVTDRAAAAFSLEVRYPFFDKRLVEFCLALPPEQKLRQGWTRMVMRRAMTNILPEEVQWRGRKGDLSYNFHHGLLSFDRPLVDEVILSGAKEIEEYVDIPALTEMYRRWVSQGASSNAYHIWAAVSLALWLRNTNLKP